MAMRTNAALRDDARNRPVDMAYRHPEGQFEQDDNPPLEGHEEKGGLRDRLSALIARLQTEADRRIARRSEVERRWLRDLRAYHGLYEPESWEKLKKETLASKVYVNMTQPRTDAMIARLFDLLFPTDDRNYGIGPTPVPEMADALETAQSTAEDAARLFADNEEKLTQAVKDGAPDEERDAIAAEMQQLEEVQTEAEQKADELQEIRREASRRADLMLAEIEDLLKASGYSAEARDVIEDACKIGMGVLKGPVTGVRSQQRFRPVTRQQADDAMTRREEQEVQQDGATDVLAEAGVDTDAFELYERFDSRPGAQRVDPWSFFPDPDARTPYDSEGFFERHLKDKAQMRKLASEPGVDADAIRRLLTAGRMSQDPTYLTDLHSLNNDAVGRSKDTWQVWEYTGVIDAEDLETIAQSTGNDNATAELDDLQRRNTNEHGEYEVDPLFELPVKIWFCQDEVIKFAIHPLDSGEPIYSWFSIVRAELGPYGYGIPHIMSAAQDMLNAAIRMLMDNARNAIGPQIVIDREAITPQDGSWQFYGNKIWLRNPSTGITTNASRQMPFEVHDFPMRMQEIMTIVELAMQLIDDVTAMPQLAMGEQGAGVTKTAQGMAILMNSANVMFRRIVKNFDDDITVPMVRRFYHFLMQFSNKQEIKGDYEVDARGSSVLLAREMQANNLMMIAERFSQNPVFADQIKTEPLLKHIFRAHSIPADEILRTDRETKDFRDQRAKQGQNDPALMALAAQKELKEAEFAIKREELDKDAAISNREWDSREYIAELNWEASVMKVEADDEGRAQDREARMTDAADRTDAQVTAELIRERRDQRAQRSKERIIAVEADVASRTGEHAGGSV